MALSSAYSLSELKSQLARHVNMGRGTLSTVQQNDLEAYINSGLKQVYYPPVLQGEPLAHVWSFLRPGGHVTTADSATGTATVDGGTVTLSSGTTASSWLGGEFTITGGETDGTAVILSVDSSSGLTIDSEELAAASAVTFTVTMRKYALPANFGGLVGNRFTYGSQGSTHAQEIRQITKEDLRAMESSNPVTGYPRFAAISYERDSDGSTKSYVEFSPRSATPIVIRFNYVLIPGELSSESSYPEGSAAMSELYLASCLDIAHQRVNDSFDLHAPFLERLRAMVMYDRRTNSVDTHGLTAKSRGLNVGDYKAALREHRRFAAYTS